MACASSRAAATACATGARQTSIAAETACRASPANAARAARTAHRTTASTTSASALRASMTRERIALRTPMPRAAPRRRTARKPFPEGAESATRWPALACSHPATPAITSAAGNALPARARRAAGTAARHAPRPATEPRPATRAFAVSRAIRDITLHAADARRTPAAPVARRRTIAPRPTRTASETAWHRLRPRRLPAASSSATRAFSATHREMHACRRARAPVAARPSIAPSPRAPIRMER